MLLLGCYDLLAEKDSVRLLIILMQLSKKRCSERVQSARLSEDKLVKGMYRDISKLVI